MLVLCPAIPIANVIAWCKAYIHWNCQRVDKISRACTASRLVTSALQKSFWLMILILCSHKQVHLVDVDKMSSQPKAKYAESYLSLAYKITDTCRGAKIWVSWNSILYIYIWIWWVEIKINVQHMLHVEQHIFDV